MHTYFNHDNPHLSLMLNALHLFSLEPSLSSPIYLVTDTVNTQ